ncbi:MAG: GNAT family N-acetyltransferase [Alteromonadaceae bacterium]|nr:GNAT family N-acetyltransferase [Alteromonadaceae bacterium]
MQINTTIKSFKLSDKHQIAEKWQDLEKRSSCSVFLSWLWISHWLDLVNEDIFIVESYQNEQIVGLGFIVETTRRVFGVIPIKQWWLHRCGDPHKDQIWIEYNDFLLDKRFSEIVRKEIIEFLHTREFAGQEFIVGLLKNNLVETFFHKTKKMRSIMDVKGYLVDFKKIKVDYSSDVLSKNTRYQIRRSKKLLEQKGELSFKVVSEPTEIALLAPEIASLHIKRWQGCTEGSGFTNVIFEKFHREMMIDDDNKVIQISVLSLNNKDLGYLVNYVYQGDVFFYLSALTIEADEKIKIGLVLHSEAIQYYVNQKYKTYDFLGGEAQYKRSLSDQSYNLSLVCFYKANFILSVEQVLRRVKASLRKTVNNFLNRIQ